MYKCHLAMCSRGVCISGSPHFEVPLHFKSMQKKDCLLMCPFIHPFIDSPFKKPMERVGSSVLQNQLQPPGKKLKKGYERTPGVVHV